MAQIGCISMRNQPFVIADTHTHIYILYIYIYTYIYIYIYRERERERERLNLCGIYYQKKQEVVTNPKV